MLLCSPIILYDYPQIAPESAGDFYDATEMDEMLTLRVMTLTDDEKNEMRRADDACAQPAAAHRTERARTTVTDARHHSQHAAGEREVMMEWNLRTGERERLESVTVFGVAVAGDRVRLWPQKSADIMDMALKGKVAIVEAIERDFEDACTGGGAGGRSRPRSRNVAPARHRFFFSPEEVEPLALNGEMSHER